MRKLILLTLLLSPLALASGETAFKNLKITGTLDVSGVTNKGTALTDLGAVSTSGDGSGLTNLTAANIASGTFTSQNMTGVVAGDLSIFKNTSISGSTAIQFQSSGAVPKLTVGYANGSVAGSRASRPFIEFAGGELRLIDSTNTKYWKVLTDASNGMTTNELVISVPTGQADNVLAIRNDDSAAGRISGLTLRASTNTEKGAFGWGNGAGTYPFSGAVFIETSNIFNATGPTVAPPFSIIQTSRNGGNTIVFHERLKFTDQGDIVFYKNDAVWPSQSAFLTLSNTSDEVTVNSRLHVTANVAGDAMEVQQLNTSGYATIGFEDQTGGNKYVLGYGLSGVAAPYTSSAYHVSVGSGGVSVPIKFVQYDGATTIALQINSSHQLIIGPSGSPITQVLTGSATLDFPSTSAQLSADLTITVTGAAVNDPVALGVPNGSVLANCDFTAWVSATNTVTVRLNNYSAIAKDPPSGTFKVVVTQF